MVDRASTPSSERRPIWAVIGLYAVLAVVLFDQIEEDAFIYYRVAQNLADGHGYVFNAGGERVECGSSVVWQFVLAAAALVRLDLLFFSKVAGIGLGAGTLYLLHGLCLRFVRSPWLAAMPCLILALSNPFSYWAQRGLETALYTFSIVLTAHVILDERVRRFWYLPALLVALSRPEGFIVIFGLAGFFYVERARRRELLFGAAVFAGTLLAVAAGRFLYFHDIVPHAFYLKMREPAGLARAAVFRFFEASHLWVAFAIAAVGLATRTAWSRPLVVVTALNVPFVVWALNTHALAINNRHLVPALPLLLLLLGVGFDRLLERFPPLVHPVAFGTALYSAWLGLECPEVDLTLLTRPNSFPPMLELAAESPGRFFSNLWKATRGVPRTTLTRNGDYLNDRLTENWQYQIGDFIATRYPKGITVLYDQMGQTPWYGGLDKTFVDTTGLTYRPTAFLALNHAIDDGGDARYRRYRSLANGLLGVFHEPYRHWHRKEAVEHLLALNAEVIIMNGMLVIRRLPDGRTENVTDNVPGMLYADPRLRERYVEHAKWFMRVFERKDLAARIPWDERGRHLPGRVPPE